MPREKVVGRGLCAGAVVYGKCMVDGSAKPWQFSMEKAGETKSFIYPPGSLWCPLAKPNQKLEGEGGCLGIINMQC